MKLSQIGEFKLLQNHVLPIVGERAQLGDDCGWMSLGRGQVLLVSIDAMVEDTHYASDWMSAGELASKALRTALSDLAAMGGADSLGCVVTLGERADTDLKRHEDFMRALKREAKRSCTAILGGDLVEVVKKEFVSTAVFGVARKKSLLKRSSLKPGDTLWLTGPLGLSRAGLEVLMGGSAKKFPFLAKSHKCPPMRMKEARCLSFFNLSRCAIDTSDSLATSLLWLATSNSGLDLEVDLNQLSVSKSVSEWSRFSGRPLEDYLLYGGEDYELLFSSAAFPKTISHYLPGCYCIGKAVRGRGKVKILNLKGAQFFLSDKKIGYQAFWKRRSVRPYA